jgi:phosphoribosylformylglycinamidine synthase
VPGTRRALALTVDCTPRYVLADPEAGGAQAVAEAWRNICATGATPLAITDNMNFGNPEKPLIMGQFAGAIRGMAAACRALDFPVVSGNVSLYNETEGRPIPPTLAIGGVGVLDDAARAVGLAMPEDAALVLLGGDPSWLGCSLWLREIAGREEGAPPPVDLAAERRAGEFVRARIAAGEVLACHDVSDGGLLVAIAEMAMESGVGAVLDTAGDHGFWFGEDQGRYVVAVADAAPLLAAARAAGVPARLLGRSGGGALVWPGASSISVPGLKAAHESALPRLMSGE